MLKNLVSGLLIFASIGYTLTVDSSEKKNVIIDTDVDIDDLLQMIYLLDHPKVNVLAITTTSNGKTHYEYCGKNLHSVLKRFGREKIPIARTTQPPLEFNGFYPEPIREKSDHLYGLNIDVEEGEYEALSSSDLMIQKLLESKENVTLICNGPMTNLARALKKEPQIKQYIDQVIVVGGALNTKGNLTQKYNGFYNKVAEYNLFLDGKGAEVVLNSGLPIILIPLDVLAGVDCLTSEIYRHLLKSAKSPFSSFFIYANTCAHQDRFCINKSITFISLIAACSLLYPEIMEMPYLKLKLTTDFGPYYGMLSLDRSGFLAKVCLKINYEELIEKLSIP